MADGSGLRRSVIFRWQRRDRLAVLTIAVTIALFTGTVLAVTAAATQTTAIAGEYGSPGVVQSVASPNGTDGVTVPVARLNTGGTTVTVVGTTPALAERVQGATGRPLPAPPPDGVSIGHTARFTSDTHRAVSNQLASSTSPAVITQRSGRDMLVPAHWYVTHPRSVERTTPDGHYIVMLRHTDPVPESGTPLQGALSFFIVGTREFVRLLLAGTAGAALLVGTTVYSIARIHVRDRTTTLRVLRAVGTPRWTILTLFSLRSLLLVTTGVALGYALGVIGANIATNISVFLGLPVSLSMRVSGTAARVLAGGYALACLTGVGAGVLATVPAVRAPPAAVGQPDRSAPTQRSLAALRVLDWRAFVPTTGALAVFVAILLVVIGAVGAVGPAIAGGGATVTEPGAAHPVASSVPETYAATLSTETVAASPEILGFTTVNGSGVLVRGSDYERFAAVRDTTLQAGTASMQPGEAIIGADLAERLGVSVGDTVTLGGSTVPAFTTVRIVGRYSAAGYLDDQLLIPLSSARHLTDTRTGRVDFIRLNRSVESTATKPRVVDVTGPSRVVAGNTFQVTATIANPTPNRVRKRVTVTWRNQTVTRAITAEPFGTATVTASFITRHTGSRPIRAGNLTHTVQVIRPSALLITAPDRVPPNATMPVQVRRADGTVPSNATIRLNGTVVAVPETGQATIRSPSPGQYTLRARAATTTAQQNVTVAADARRQFLAAFAVPSAPQPGTRVTVTLRLHNPWDQELTRRVSITLPDRDMTQTITLGADETRTLRFRTHRLIPGSFHVRAQTPSGRLAGTTVNVQGDPRLVSAVAAHTGTAAGTTSVGRAITTVIGNIQILAAILILFAALTTVGSTAAAFTRSVRAQYRTIGIHRALGATPWQVCRLVFRDALIVGSIAAVTAVGLGVGSVAMLDTAGLLTLFGVNVGFQASPRTVLGAWAGAVALVVIGTALALIPVLRASPWTLITVGEGG